MKKDDLKCGDTIEVYSVNEDSRGCNWVNRTFVAYEKNESVIYVCGGSMYKFRNPSYHDFLVAVATKNNWRLKEEPKYIPLTDEELISRIPFVVLLKDNFGRKYIYTITGYIKDATCNGKFKHNMLDNPIAASELFDEYTFIDGSTIGKLSV